MMTITQLIHSFNTIKQSSVDGMSPQKVQSQESGDTRKAVQLLDVLANIFNGDVEKPTLAVPASGMTVVQLQAALNELSNEDRKILLNNLSLFISLSPEQLEQAVEKVLAAEQKTIEQVFGNNQKLDEADIKLIAQAIHVIVGSSFFAGLQPSISASESVKAETKSIESVKNDSFVGIISSDIMMELIKLVRKVVAELNISDRRISADFLQLSGKMTEAAAESTIKEGKEMFSGALTGFFTALAISGAGAAFQARALHQQNQSIKNNLVKANQNGAAADRLNELNANSFAAGSAKGNALTLKNKDGVSVELADQATPAQQALANQRGAEAAQRTNKLGLAERDEHERIMNKTRVHIGIADQGSRLSDNAGQLATTSNQVNVKAEEANKMTQQSVADAARSVSSDKDKQLDKSNDLVKQMNEHLREIREGQLRTFQTVVRG